jgi:F-type H+-transporting ATPase subunit a
MYSDPPVLWRIPRKEHGPATNRAGNRDQPRLSATTEGYTVANDPIHQFQISKIIPIENVGGTGSLLHQRVAVHGRDRGRDVAVPVHHHGQSRPCSGPAAVVSEMAYEFVASMLRDAAGTQGMRFFPLVFSLFMFVLVANLFGMFPYFFTVTSTIIVTFALAIW